MFGRKESYKYTDQLRQALVRARKEARGLRHDYVGTEHLLLGLLHTAADDEASLLLERLGVSILELERELRASVSAGPEGKVTTSDPPYTSRAKESLELALKESRDTAAGYVGTAHLLLGLVAEGKSIAAQVLTARFGVELERARVLARNLSEGPSSSRSLNLTLDDHSDLSIYEQIVAQLQEAVATGAVRPDERLPTVRQLADRLDIAPGTVARAYAELERRGVVVTGGSRGTRVAGPGRSPVADAGRLDSLVGLLRPVAVAAYHLGANADELRRSLEKAMEGIFREDAEAK
jgi:DNA-binding transcriptional regulator YhcF (GntR family)